MEKIRRAIRAGLVILLCGCAVGVLRHGYVLDPALEGKSCNVAIKRDFKFADLEMKVLGNIEVYDNLLSVDCDERAVFDTVIADACALRADVINVTGEKQPDYFWTMCYRVNAQFLRLADPEQAIQIESDPHYEMAAIQQRASISTQRAGQAYAIGMVGMILGSLIAGFMVNTADGSK